MENEMRKLIDQVRSFGKLLNENTSEQNISQIIKLTSNEYQEENQCSLWDINNGLCEDFAQAVIEKMGGYNDNLYEISGDMFFASREPEFAKENWGNIIETEYGVWSVDLLKHWGYPPNVDLNLVNDELNHTWIYFNGKHYDAEAPNGVDKWYDLPLNKKFFNRFKKLG
jgi:hypothetical protein